MLIEGSLSAKVLFITTLCGVNERAENLVVTGHNRETLLSSLRRGGLISDDYCLVSLGQHPIKTIVQQSQANVLVPMDNTALEMLTGHKSCHKWHCSVLTTKTEFGKRKVLPILPLAHINKKYGDSAYLTVAAIKLKVEKEFPEDKTPERKFILAQDFRTAYEYLQDVVVKAPELAIDIENSSSQINTVGFAISPTEAIAVRTSLECYNKEEHWLLWQLMAKILESDKPKYLQNYIHEQIYFSHYGIEQKNVTHDTMVCMKFLHPEFDQGLDNVGRVYTPYPYWKDDNDDWTNIQDWDRHLEYNCKDTTGTFAAALKQRQALKDRKLWDLYYNYQHKLMGPVTEMCTHGLLLDPVEHQRQKEEVLTKISHHQNFIQNIFKDRVGHTVNTRSSKQMKTALKAMGITMPTKKDKKSGEFKETADKKALVKLARKYPKELIFKELIALTKLNKLFSSYIDFKYDERTNKVRYTINSCGTETWRFAAYKDPMGNGFNPQTVPKPIRKMFTAAPGKTLIQIDLAQAESRYVAYDAPEPTLIKMLENREDVHTYVATKIFKKLSEMISYAERQLGKKSGHSANYGVGANTFAEAALVENDIFLSKWEAQRIIDGYFEIFPGVRKRQQRIQQQIRNTKFMKNPIGMERFFYDRIGDSTFREAYAHEPQSTIPAIMNHLMLFLYDTFEDLEFLLQVHDSILLQYDTDRVSEIFAAARDYKAWHPKITLAGGDLVIPVDIEIGHRWGKMEKVG